MRKTLLTTVAAAALIASAGIASAQNAQPNAEPRGGAQMKSDSPVAPKSDAVDKAAPEKAAPKPNAQAKPDADKAKGAADNKDVNAPARSNAQAKPDADAKAKRAAETADPNQPAKDSAQTTPNNATKSATDGKTTTDTNKSASDSKSSSKTTVSLSTEQRTKIRTTVLQQSNAPRVSKVDFSISVGTKVPRTVRHSVLPTTVVEVYPQWRGFLYFIVGDEIVVVEPNTLEIVAVLQA